MDDVKRIREIIKKYKQMENPLIMILHEVQDINGHLSYDMMKVISNELKMSINEIYSVASFYKDFRINPIGKYKISVCLGTVCYIKGANNILSEITRILGIKNGECTEDFKFSLDTTRCLGCCSMAPVVAINDKIYGDVEVSDVKKILEEYKSR